MNYIIFPLFLVLSSLAFPALAWTVSADFDSGQVGNQADRGGDGLTGAGGNTIYTTEQAVSGQAAKLTIERGETGYGKWGGELTFPRKAVSGDTIWYQVHTYFPEGFDHYSYGEGNRLKFLRIHTLSSSGDNRGYIDLYIDMKGSYNPFKWIYEGALRWHDVGEPEDMIVLGSWESYQMRVTLDDISVDSGGQAEIYIWKNGRLLEHFTDRRTLTSDTDYAPRALLFTYWNGGAPKTQSMYVDNITITTDRPSGKDSNGIAMVPSMIQGSLPTQYPPAPIESFSVE